MFEGGFRLVEEDEFIVSSDEEEDGNCNALVTSNTLTRSFNKLQKNNRMKQCNSNGFRIISNVLEVSRDSSSFAKSTSIGMLISCIVSCLNC